MRLLHSRMRLVQVAALAAVAILAVQAGGLVVGGTPGAAALTNCSVDASIDAEERAFLTLINDYRADHELPALVLSENLSRASAWKARNMAGNDYFAHDDTPIGRGWSQRIRDCGYTANTYLGENIAAGNAAAADTFDQWKNSPGHNANMLSERFVVIGIGRAHDPDSRYRWYWATNFGGVAEGIAAGMGDVSCDGGVNALDAAYVLQYIAGRTASLPCGDQADTDGDGAISAADALLILQFDARMIAGFSG